MKSRHSAGYASVGSGLWRASIALGLVGACMASAALAQEAAAEEEARPQSILEQAVLPAEGASDTTVEMAPPLPAPDVADPVLEDIGREYDRVDEPPADIDSTAGFREDNPMPELAKYALKAMAALIVMVGFILLLFGLLKKYGKRHPLLAGSTLARVMGKVHLDRGVALHFVQTGGKVLVLGVGGDKISLITEYDSSEFDMARDAESAEMPEGAVERPEHFLKELRASRDALMDAIPPEDDEIDSLKGDIQRLQQYLRESASDPES